MKIVADENMPYVNEVFSVFGDVLTCPGRLIDSEKLRDADILLVRSITPVNEHLLEGSTVRFVGSATSGLDHIDQECLKAQGIGFSHAQGANARSVAEYVVAATLELLDDDQQLSDLTCGIVGYGHVGSCVYQMLLALGIQCRVVDPFLIPAPGDPDFCERASITDCDVVTFHVPLTHDGYYPTHHMIDAALLGELKNDTILINASRGAVADTTALLEAKKMRPTLRYVLDVWENEPNIDQTLVSHADIATPHIAGYSWDGKVDGTRRLFDGLNTFLDTDETFPEVSDAPAPPVSYISAPESPQSPVSSLREAVRFVYSVTRDDAALRKSEGNGGTHGDLFDRLRKSYWPRREFGAVQVNSNEWSAEMQNYFRALGFHIDEQ